MRIFVVLIFIGLLVLSPSAVAAVSALEDGELPGSVNITAKVLACNRGDGQVRAAIKFQATVSGDKPSYVKSTLVVLKSGVAQGFATRKLYPAKNFKATVKKAMNLAANSSYKLKLNSRIKFKGFKSRRQVDRGKLKIAAAESYSAC